MELKLNSPCLTRKLRREEYHFSSKNGSCLGSIKSIGKSNIISHPAPQSHSSPASSVSHKSDTALVVSPTKKTKKKVINIDKNKTKKVKYTNKNIS